MASFEKLAMPELQVDGSSGLHVIVIDEIGRMEMHAKGFSPAVMRLFEQPNVVLVGSVAAPRYGHKLSLAEEVKARSDVIIIPLKKSTREQAARDAQKSLDRLIDAHAATRSTTAVRAGGGVSVTAGAKKRKLE